MYIQAIDHKIFPLVLGTAQVFYCLQSLASGNRTLELFPAPREKYSVLLPDYTLNNCIQKFGIQNSPKICPISCISVKSQIEIIKSSLKFFLKNKPELFLATYVALWIVKGIFLMN